MEEDNVEFKTGALKRGAQLGLYSIFNAGRGIFARRGRRLGVPLCGNNIMRAMRKSSLMRCNDSFSFARGAVPPPRAPRAWAHTNHPNDGIAQHSCIDNAMEQMRQRALKRCACGAGRPRTAQFELFNRLSPAMPRAWAHTNRVHLGEFNHEVG